MENSKKNRVGEYYTIDLLQIAKALWKHIWAVILAAVIGASAGFSYAYFFIAPTYSSSIMLYVNNSTFSLGNTNVSISSSQIMAAQSLVNTYTEILNNRTTYERVIQKSGVDYTPAQLAGMITAGSSNGTEIMKVTVVSTDPHEAADIANCIAEILPARISEVIAGASMEVVDTAVPNLHKIAPNITMHALIGLILGALCASGVIVILVLLDDTIHDEEYILQSYDYPVLAKLPDLLGASSRHHGYKYYGYYDQKSYAASRDQKNDGK